MGDDERLLQSAGTDVGMRRWSQSCTVRSRGLLLLLLELESMGRGGARRRSDGGRRRRGGGGRSGGGDRED